MAESTLEALKKQLDAELDSQTLLSLPSDFYAKVSAYCQKLRRTSTAGASEVTVRLIGAQIQLIRSMTGSLLKLRADKADRLHALLQLLPEERYVCSAQERFYRRLESFIEAVSEGRPSYVEFAHRSEGGRSVTVRFRKPVSELVGLDLRRYGPFETDDVASIPAASADILISNGDAVEVYTRDEA